MERATEIMKPLDAGGRQETNEAQQVERNGVEARLNESLRASCGSKRLFAVEGGADEVNLIMNLADLLGLDIEECTTRDLLRG